MHRGARTIATRCATLRVAAAAADSNEQNPGEISQQSKKGNPMEIPIGKSYGNLLWKSL
jgi:hypothetical protein